MNSPSLKNKYFAFISYKREDEEWAIWFQHEMENYHLPVTLHGRTDLPSEFRPVFRDIDELKAGNLPEQIYNALSLSTYLIVICSPHSTNSEWINKEIKDFIEIGKAKGVDNVRNIFPFIVDGHPHAQKKEDECFPQALLDLPKEQELIGGNVNEGNPNSNVNESGRDRAFVKVLAGMLPNVAFDELWNRYERDKAKEERRRREEMDKILTSQSRFVAEKARRIAEKGSYLATLLALEILPQNLNNPNRPYTQEAEFLLRESLSHNTAMFQCHRQAITCVSCSPDGKLIATSSRENSVKIWDINTGALIKTLEGHTSKVNSVHYSPNGDLIVTASKDGTIRIWDANSATELFVLNGDGFSVNSALFSPDGKRIASVSENTMVSIWDVASGEEIKSIYGNNDEVFSVAFSPDGSQILTVSRDTSVRIFDVDSEKELFLSGSPEMGMALTASFSPDGKKILSVSFDDKAIHIWDVSSGSELLKIQESCFFATFSPDGREIVTDSLSFYDSETGEKTMNLNIKGVEYVTFRPAPTPGFRWVIAGLDDGSIFIRKTVSEDAPIEFLAFQRCHLAIYSPDSNFIAADTLGTYSIRVWDIRYEKPPISLIGHSRPISTIAFSPDGKRLVSASHDKTIRIWNVETGRALKSLIGHQEIVKSAFFSPDGKRVVSTSRDHTIRIWDVSSGKELQKWQVDVDYGYEYAIYSSDGKQILAYSICGIIRVLEATTGMELKSLTDYEDGFCIFCPNGKLYASALANDKSIRIVDIDSGKELKSMIGHNDMIAKIVFSPDGHLLLSIGYDTMRIWDVQSGKELKCYYKRVYMASFSNDATQIISVSENGFIDIWPFPPLQELINQNRERFKERELTIEERKEYYLE